MKRVLAILLVLFGVMIAQEDEKSDPRAIIEKVRIYRLTQELDLTTEQAIQFFPRLRELQKIDTDFRTEQKALLEDMRSLIEEKAEEKEILQSLNRYEVILKDKVERQLEKLREIRKMLTPEQQAKYLIFQDDFEREIRRMIKEVRKLQPR
jgi:isoleucyl-tRNA synthetase